MPFWVKSLNIDLNPHLHFWILQLIYVALTIPFPDYASHNYKLFKKANGMTALFGILNTTFSELIPKESMIEDEQEECKAKMTNFTGISENLDYFERNTVGINKCIVVINILESLHEHLVDPHTIPMPSFYQY